jgi:hypothetical protein
MSNQRARTAEERLRELARQAADRNHEYDFRGLHSDDTRDCTHPDCVLVRSAGSAPRKPWCQMCGVELGGLYCDTCREVLAGSAQDPEVNKREESEAQKTLPGVSRATAEGDHSTERGDDGLGAGDQSSQRHAGDEVVSGLAGTRPYARLHDGRVAESGAQAPETPPDKEPPAKVKTAVFRYINTLVITSDNVGDIRRSLFMPYDCKWNGWIRDMTAELENKSSTAASPLRTAPPEEMCRCEHGRDRHPLIKNSESCLVATCRCQAFVPRAEQEQP